MTEPKRLGKKAKSLLKSKKNKLYLSAASSWEIAIKTGLGKLSLPEPPDKYISSRMASLNIAPLDVKHYLKRKIHLPLTLSGLTGDEFYIQENRAANIIF